MRGCASNGSTEGGSVTPNQKRALGATLVAGAALFATLKQDEAFVGTAMQPVPGDRYTYAYGATYRPDGTPVQKGDTITREQADTLLSKTVADKYEAGINKCAGDILMYPYEKDILVELAYQNGPAAVCGYSIIAKFRAGDYGGGCASILTIDKLQGRHCSRPENRHRTDGCNGLMNRREKQQRFCSTGVN